MRGRLLLCILIFNIISYNLFAQEQKYVIKQGDTLSSLLKDYYTPSQILDISKKIKGRVNNFYLKAGNTISFSKDKLVLHLSYDKDIVILKMTKVSIYWR